MIENSFKELLNLAIGKNTSQNEFAKQAGISPEHLSRMLRHPEKYPPSAATLKKIAEASNGRVSLSRLEEACGMDPSEPAGSEPELAEGDYDAAERVREYKKGVMDFSGKATRYDNLYDVLETVEILYGRGSYRYIVADETDYKGRGHAGAERAANITVEFATDEYTCKFGFVMFYCRTEKGGIIFSDAAFDLLTLNDFRHPVGTRKLFEISTHENENRSKYNTVYIVEKNV